MQSLIQDCMLNYSVSTPVNLAWNKFAEICNHCLKLISTKTSSVKFHQPWITNHVKLLTRRKQRAYNHARLTNHPNDWSSYYDITYTTRVLQTFQQLHI